MEKKEVGLGNPVSVAGLTLIPVVQVLLNHWQGKSGSTSFFSTKQPLAIVVISPSVQKAFRVTGEEVTLDQLVQEIPEVKAFLAETLSSSR